MHSHPESKSKAEIKEIDPRAVTSIDPVREFKKFWSMSLDDVIQEILDGKDSRLIYRMFRGLEYASEKDKADFRAWAEKLEAKNKKMKTVYRAMNGLFWDYVMSNNLDILKNIIMLYLNATKKLMN